MINVILTSQQPL